MSMPHELLSHADGCSNRVKPGPIGVAEGMPTNTLHSKLFRSGTNVVLLNRACVKTPVGDVTGEDPISRGLPACKYPPAEPVALRLLAPQRGLTATVRSKSKNKSKSLVLLSSLPQHRLFEGEHTPGILKALLPPRQSRGISSPFSLTIQQNGGEVRVQRKFIFRALGLHWASPAVH